MNLCLFLSVYLFIRLSVASVTRHDNVACVNRHDNEACVTRPEQSPRDVDDTPRGKTSHRDAQEHYRKLYGRFKTSAMCKEYIEYK
jgi:hypothetical protein